MSTVRPKRRPGELFLNSRRPDAVDRALSRRPYVLCAAHLTIVFCTLYSTRCLNQASVMESRLETHAATEPRSRGQFRIGRGRLLGLGIAAGLIVMVSVWLWRGAQPG